MLPTFFSDKLPYSPFDRKIALTLSVNPTILQALGFGNSAVCFHFPTRVNCQRS